MSQYVKTEVRCPVCDEALGVKPCVSKRGKTSLALRCAVDGRHFRGFISDAGFVHQVIERGMDNGDGPPKPTAI